MRPEISLISGFTLHTLLSADPFVDWRQLHPAGL